jgi:hypothetical protein
MWWPIVAMRAAADVALDRAHVGREGQGMIVMARGVRWGLACLSDAAITMGRATFDRR